MVATKLSTPVAGADLRGSFQPSILAGTCLEAIPEDVARAILIGAQEHRIPAGEDVFPFGNGTHIGVLLEGWSRSYIQAADGKQLTTRYGGPGSLTSRRVDECGDTASIRIQAMTDCRILELDREALLRLAETEPQLAMALVTELSSRLTDIYVTAADAAFGSMRQRVTRHLLALATPPGHGGGRAIARVTQQQLADAIGASREGVARMLAVLREEGVVRTSPKEIEVLDLERLWSFLG